MSLRDTCCSIKRNEGRNWVVTSTRVLNVLLLLRRMLLAVIEQGWSASDETQRQRERERERDQMSEGENCCRVTTRNGDAHRDPLPRSLLAFRSVLTAPCQGWNHSV